MLINLRNALMAGKRTPTAKDYVQSGLIAMWDGIENAGWGTHDPNATVWKDLVGSLDAEKSGSPMVGDKFTNTSNGYWILPSGILSIVQADNLTAEVVFKSDGIDRSNQGVVGIGDNRALWLFFGNPPSGTSSSLTWQVRSSSGIRVWYNEGTFGAGTHSSSVVNNNKVCNCYLDATLRTKTVDVAAGTSTSSSSLWLGRMTGYNNFYGNIYSIRLYSRALTADEIAANYAIDKARFNLP